MVLVCFLYSHIAPEVKQYLLGQLSSLSDLEIFIPLTDSEEELLPQVKKAQILIGWKISPSLLSSAKNFDLFISPYTGVSYLLKAFSDAKLPHPVTIVNGHGAAPLIAQHAIALLLSCLNGIQYHHEFMKAGNWNPGGEGVQERMPSYDIAERHIGLLGYGQINKRVHQMLSGFVDEVAICRNSWTNRSEKYPTKVKQFSSETLEQFFCQIDTLIIAAPLTDQTKDLVREKQLQLLGPKGVLVNVGRGKIVNEKDLFNALTTGQISRAALDVWYNYHPEPDNLGRHFPYSENFHSLPNLIMSPHRADSPFDDLRRWDDIIENIKRYVAGKNDFLNIVDIEKGY